MVRVRDRAPPSAGGEPAARDIAASVLWRVHQDRAFAAAVLDAAFDRHPQLDARERALTTELVYGCLRTHGALLSALQPFASRGLPGGDYLVTAHLLVAAYQLLLLDRVPAFAAVDAAVRAVRVARGPRVAGFANALLRRLAAAGPRLPWETAVLDSAPQWLRERLERAVGFAETRALLGASARPGQSSSPAVRTATGASRPPGDTFDTPASLDPGTIAVRVVAAAPPAWLACAPVGRLSARARLVSRPGNLRQMPGWTEGAFVVQEEGSQVVALALGVRPGERVLDACAGHGTKSSLLAEQLGPAGQLWVADLHSSKLGALRGEFRRLGLAQPQAAAVDWTAGPGPIPGQFDRVLVDAPCTGTGTLRRRPEIALRLRPGDPDRLGALARQIVRQASSRLRPGGRLVFAVCSVLPEEYEPVVQGVTDVLRPVPFDAPDLPSAVRAEAVSFRLLPLEHGTDGYYIASFTTRD